MLTIPRAAPPACLCFLIVLALPSASRADDSQALFHIERSMNANIVRYDLRMEEDGSIDRDDPVDAYWLRLAEDGQRKDLSWIQRKLAYGYKAEVMDDNTVVIRMSVQMGRSIRVVQLDDGSYRAETRVDGATVVLDRIFVQVKDAGGFGRLPEISYIEIYGRDLETGEERQERVRPRS